MVKQGKFTKTTGSKRIKSQRYKQSSGQGTITDEQLSEFMLVRYHLTRGKKQAPVTEQSILRFIDGVVDQLDNQNFNMKECVEVSLRNIGMSVPWAFYRIVLVEWDKLLPWLTKELQAVPIVKPIRLIETSFNMDDIIAKQLAVNWWVSQSKGDITRLQAVTADKIESLSQTFKTDDGIDWNAVQTVYSTVLFEVTYDVDSETQEWLEALKKLQ